MGPQACGEGEGKAVTWRANQKDLLRCASARSRQEPELSQGPHLAWKAVEGHGHGRSAGMLTQA